MLEFRDPVTVPSRRRIENTSLEGIDRWRRNWDSDYPIGLSAGLQECSLAMSFFRATSSRPFLTCWLAGCLVEVLCRQLELPDWTSATNVNKCH